VFITECVFDNIHIVGTPSIEYWHVLDKQDVKQNMSHLFLNTQHCCQNYIIRTF